MEHQGQIHPASVQVLEIKITGSEVAKEPHAQHWTPSLVTAPRAESQELDQGGCRANGAARVSQEQRSCVKPRFLDLSQRSQSLEGEEAPHLYFNTIR